MAVKITFLLLRIVTTKYLIYKLSVSDFINILNLPKRICMQLRSNFGGEDENETQDQQIEIYAGGII